jgi:lysophosphatidate acyltransferase
MAKKELKWSPLLGQYMALSGAVFVDRKNNKDALKALAAAGEEMKAKGVSSFARSALMRNIYQLMQVSLWVFPEGTRSSSEAPNLLPFKKGAFHLAVQAGVPIIPVVCENYWRLYRKGTLEEGTLRIRGSSSSPLFLHTLVGPHIRTPVPPSPQTVCPNRASIMIAKP